MALTVETGAGVSSADAFISLSDVTTYHADQGNAAWAAGAEADQETAIRRATNFLSNSYQWKGRKRNGRDQSLAWPRSGAEDDEGYAVGFDDVPVEVANATAEVALRELATPGAMSPDYTPSERVKSEKVGSLAVEYDLSRTDAESARPVLLIVRDMIGPLLDRASGSRLSGEAVRA